MAAFASLQEKPCHGFYSRRRKKPAMRRFFHQSLSAY
jgi:hypothetical protein